MSLTIKPQTSYKTRGGHKATVIGRMRSGRWVVEGEWDWGNVWNALPDGAYPFNHQYDLIEEWREPHKETRVVVMVRYHNGTVGVCLYWPETSQSDLVCAVGLGHEVLAQQTITLTEEQSK